MKTLLHYLNRAIPLVSRFLLVRFNYYIYILIKKGILISKGSWNTNYISDPAGSSGCGENTTAWSYPLLQSTPIHLCNPNYWNKNDEERPLTLIHEMFHLYYIAGDWAYDWEEDYEELNTLQSLTNADSFATFIGDLCL